MNQPESVLHSRCLDVLHSSSPKELLSHAAKFVTSHGLSTIGLSVIIEHSAALSEFRTLTNVPAGYIEDFENLAQAKLDPVSQHCKSSSLPIIWGQDFYVNKGRGDFWEHQASFGLRSGISVAMHLPRGRHFLVGVDSEELSVGGEARRRNLASDIFTYTAYAQAAAFDLCLPYACPANETELAKGELDVLSWSIEGKSDLEIGERLGISSTEALLRIRRAMIKLGASTKYEAAIRAIRRGLICCG